MPNKMALLLKSMTKCKRITDFLEDHNWKREDPTLALRLQIHSVFFSNPAIVFPAATASLLLKAAPWCAKQGRVTIFVQS